MDANWWKDSFDDQQWVDYGIETLAVGSRIEWVYPVAAEIEGIFFDRIKLSPLLRVRRFSDSVEVITGAIAAQFDSQGRIEGRCVLSHGDMRMILGVLAPKGDCSDRLTAESFSLATKHRFELRSAEPTITGAYSVHAGCDRRIALPSLRPVVDSLKKCTEFIKTQFG